MHAVLKPREADIRAYPFHQISVSRIYWKQKKVEVVEHSRSTNLL